jgi:hypothetical protein
MRQSPQTPSIIPADEPTVYLAADDFGGRDARGAKRILRIFIDRYAA